MIDREQAQGWTYRMVCPFCLAEFPPGPAALCGGSFLDRDHPSAVRPILIDVTPDGVLADGSERRLADARESYR